ncbi:MAG TPA: FAD-binding oxidoreductase [Acidimicrobiales bacterium]|nr:FAD-binding oxidoreductase [Acidimicrobiales bacterium]
MTAAHGLGALGPGVPTAPIALPDPAAASARLTAGFVEVDEAMQTRLAEVCSSVSVAAAERAEASRDWWPLAMIWALDNQVAGRAAVVVRPGSAAEVASVLALCDQHSIPVTPAAGRSGVCGASVPVHGGVLLDLCDLDGHFEVDETSLVLDVAPGVFGDHLEHRLRDDHGATLGHWPQSVALSTVGGWIACRGAGQLSTRYGKIEDMVLGLDVALADGTLISTGGAPRAAVGPDLTQIFVGSEGTLGVITGARLRLHPAPTHERRAAFGFASFADGLEVCRQIMHRGARPAVLRLYDAAEANRSYSTGDRHVVLVLDEGDEVMVDATMQVVEEVCAHAERLDDALVGQWLDHRNEVSALEGLISKGFVVDTMEVAASWAALPAIYQAGVDAIGSVPGTLSATAHQSHSYPDGACLYFTFAGRTEPDQREAYYRAAWDAGTHAVLDHGGALSHHHGVGLNRSRFVPRALGEAFGVLQSMKHALDPNGILNPGKFGLADPFGSPEWP